MKRVFTTIIVIITIILFFGIGNFTKVYTYSSEEFVVDTSNKSAITLQLTQKANTFHVSIPSNDDLEEHYHPEEDHHDHHHHSTDINIFAIIDGVEYPFTLDHDSDSVTHINLFPISTPHTKNITIINLPHVADIKITATNTDSYKYKWRWGENTDAKSTIITRAEWWANEEFRYADSHTWQNMPPLPPSKPSNRPTTNPYFPKELKPTKFTYTEGSRPLIWTKARMKDVQKIIIHHTASAYYWADDASVIRGIYRFHALSHRWGDIGYHFIIGRDGKIYQWRSGGDRVVGAHAKWNNFTSVGIALLGNFNQQYPNKLQLDSLENLTTSLAKRHKINIEDYSQTYKEAKICTGDTCEWKVIAYDTTNLIGHSEAGNTSCPWLHLTNYLDILRQKVAQNTHEFFYPRSLSIKPINKAMSLDIGRVKNPRTDKTLTFVPHKGNIAIQIGSRRIPLHTDNILFKGDVLEIQWDNHMTGKYIQNIQIQNRNNNLVLEESAKNLTTTSYLIQ